MSDRLPFVENEAKKRFEFELEGELAVIEYIRSKGRMFLTHTEVPQALGGKGYARKMVESILHQVEKEELRLVPLCPYVAAYIRKHPEWERLID